MNKVSTKTANVKWYQSLNIQGILGLLTVTIWLVLGLVVVMKTRGQKLVLKESFKLIEEIGNNEVSNLQIRTSEIASLTRSLATIGEELPKDEELFKKVIPSIINFQGDMAVAGGGIWPEPYVFDPNVERRSFFWGRNRDEILEYYDDYNQPGNGYHNEEWYVVVRYSQPGKCFWSQSYMDPYSYQPMVTCTVATFEEDRFSGVATIDLKLEGLHELVNSWQNKTGGYAFILDRHNRFITFPEPDLVKKIKKDSQGNPTEEFIVSTELAAQEILFAPMSDVLEKLNTQLIEQAKSSSRYHEKIAKKIDNDSYQINAKQAELINAIISANQQKRPSTYLLEQINLKSDFLLKEEANAFVFIVPESHWKLVIVQPRSQAISVAENIIQLLIIYLSMTIIFVVVITYFIIRKFLIQPLVETSNVMNELGEVVIEKRYDDLKNCQIDYSSNNELGKLVQIFNTLTNQLSEVTQDLKRLKQTQMQLVHSAKMSSLGEMLAGIAHEINNPVNFIYGNITHLEEYIGELLGLIESYKKSYPNPSEIVIETLEESDLEFIEKDLPKLLSSMNIGAKRIRDIVLSLRNFSRLDESEMKEVDIHEGIDNTLLILQNKIQNNSMGIEIIKDYAELPKVECYAGQLNQVFMNLIANAIDAFDDDKFNQNKVSQITVQTKIIEQNYIAIIIKDNGEGISEEVKSKIFDPFFTTKKVGKGTGIGLAISYEIVVEKHKGNIVCESVLGKGTTFTIQIPISNLRH